MRIVLKLGTALSLAGLLACLTGPVGAVPLLQIYVEGATYDNNHESWVFDANSADPIDLWVIGNVDGPGGKGLIEDVRLSVVYPQPASPVTIGVVPSTTANYGGFADPSTPGAPSHVQTVTDGSTPTLGDGSSLAPHGTYGPGWEWQEFKLGDFSLTDSPIADFITTFPSAPATMEGQINVYEITLDSDIRDAHFDVYDHVVAGNHAKYTFAPFSHDAGTGTNAAVPEPTTLALLGFGLAGLGWRRRRSGTPD